MRRGLKTLLFVTVTSMSLAFTACGSEAATTTPTAAPTAAPTATPVPTATSAPTATVAPTATPEPTPTEVPVSEIKRKASAVHTYTSFVDGSGNSKLTEYEITDLYFSASQVADYAVFYGYSMEGYYNLYPKYFQEFEADGVTVKTDYIQLLKDAMGSNTFVQVNETIENYLEKIASLYYGEAYKDYWTYFCFIPEDSQEYQQLYDANGVAKISGYAQSDLYVSTKAVLSCVYYGYTMDQYYKWYESYGYFKVDNVDYFAKLTTAMNGELYAPVTDEIKECLEKISLAYYKDSKYWDYFCFVKTDIIPEGKFESVTTDYYKILEAECGHNQFVKVNDAIKEALKYVSLTYYTDEQYWDYWCYTTYKVTGETPVEGSEYTTLVGADGEYKTIEYSDADLYVNLDVTFDYTWNWGGDTVYSMAQWYSYGGNYAGNFIKTEMVEITE